MDSSPEEKYLYDNKYHIIVDAIVTHLNAFTFTPQEIREVVLIACLRFEMGHSEYAEVPVEAYPKHVIDALNTLSEWRETRS